MKKFRVVFMGTPEFSVPCLSFLDKNFEVIAVFTQPDRPRGRGQKIQESPVKQYAVAHDIPVYQPQKIKQAESVAKLRELAPDLMVVVAFGQILSQEILDIPPYGCINVHASLLPLYRGASPMQAVLMAGEKKTGVTTMRMDAGLDTGDILVRRECAIGEDMTLAELHDRLMVLGTDTLRETLERLSDGTLTRTKQTGETSYAPLLTKETGHIDWKRSAADLHNLVRALDSWPGAYTFLAGKKYKIWATHRTGEPTSAAPGTILRADKKTGLLVATGDEVLEVTSLQAPGKKRMAARDYLNGHAIALPAQFVF